MIDRFWNHFNVETKEHFYHSGARIENRHAMTEALVFNFELHEPNQLNVVDQQQNRQQLQLQLNFA